jgi:hypothetical protein
MENTDKEFAQAMRVTALVSFLVGTALFLSCLQWGGWLMSLGLAFLVVATLVNLPLFSITLSMGIKARDKNLVLSAALLLLNVPVMSFYVWLVLAKSASADLFN